MTKGKKMIVGVLLAVAVISSIFVNAYHKQKLAIQEQIRQEEARRAGYERALKQIERKYGAFRSPLDVVMKNMCFVKQAWKAEQQVLKMKKFLFDYACRFTNKADAAQYANSIVEHSKTYKKDPLLIGAIVQQESEFYKNEIGCDMDAGPMQIIPSTAKSIARDMRMKYDYDMLFNIDTNIEMGTKYFQDQVVASRSFGTFRRTSLKPEYIGLILYNRGLGNALNEFKSGQPITWYAEDVMKIYRSMKSEYESIP